MLHLGSCCVLFEFYVGFVLVSMFGFWLDLIQALFGCYSDFIRVYLVSNWVLFETYVGCICFPFRFCVGFYLGFYVGSMWGLFG